MKRVAIYVRVSTIEQKKHGMSVDSQLDALQEFCKNNNMQVADIYNDAGISARKTYRKRPALLRLLDDCQSGKIDLIIFTKIDRWFRSVADYYEVQKILDDCSIAWRAIWEDYETETSSGRFKVNIMLSIAQAESDRTSERIKAVNQYLREQNRYVGGQAPTGYIKSKGKLIKDEAVSDAVEAFFVSYVTYHSVSKARKASEEKGLYIARATAQRMLHNPRYCGEEYGCECEAYITKEQFDRNQEIIQSGYRESSGTHKTYLFSRILVCSECGGKMRSTYSCDISKKGNKSIRMGYQCNIHLNKGNVCSGGYLGEKKIERILLDILDDRLHDAIIEATTSAKASNNKKEYDKLKKKLDRVGIRFEEGDISAEEYRQKRDSIKKEMTALTAQTAIRVPKELPSNWKDVYNELDAEHKKAFWSNTIESMSFSKSDMEHPRITFR